MSAATTPFQAPTHTATKIIGLWAVPRSVSTAFERTFAERRDTTIVHEPFTDCYYFSRWRRSRRYGDVDERLDYRAQAAIDGITAQATTPMVFFKDLCFQAWPYVDDDFLGTVANTFIIRHPAVVLHSLLPLKPDFTEEEFGFTSFLEMWQQVTSQATMTPILVDGDHFREDPATVLATYCRRLEIAFDPEMLRWSSGRIKRWAAHEEQSQAKWHATLERSRRILPPEDTPRVAVDGRRRPIYRRALEIYESVIGCAI